MKIIDMRPRRVRLISALWGKTPPDRGRLDAVPAALPVVTPGMNRIVDRIIARRVAGRRLDPAGPFVVSVGNLSLGGTGKTPVVVALAADLAAAGWKGAVLTRGFGSRLGGPLPVAHDNVLAGDEARLMARLLEPAGWSVVQSRHRSRGMEFLRRSHPELDIVIVEDGHQTARLGRHLDILILDSWTLDHKDDVPRIRPVTGAVFPFGPWRESSAGADRAGILLLETDDPVPAAGIGGQAIASFSRELSLIEARDGSTVEAPEGRAGVLSGIARPEAFEAATGHLLDREPVVSIRFGDHADYTPRDAARIIRHLRDDRVDFVVTTAKDWVKLGPFWSAGPRVLVADLQISWGGGRTLPEMVSERLDARHGPRTG